MRSLRLTLLTIGCLAMSVAAFGSGFSIFEQGAKASGMAGAFAGTADDPSAIFYNPAGIAQQRELTILAGATFINFTNKFTGDPNDLYTGGVEAKYNPHTFVPPNMYGVMPIGDNLTVGFGAFSAWGLRTDWEDPWLGRYISRDADLKTLSLQPTIAWQGFDGRVAVGGGIEYRRARVFLNANTLALSPFSGRFVDVANTRLASDYGDGIGLNAGVLFKASDGSMRLGASYRTAMDIDLQGTADITQIPSGNAQFDAIVNSQLPPDQSISMTLPFPSVVAVGVAYCPTERIDIEFDVTRTSWSAFEALTVDFETTPDDGFTREQNWHDTSSYRIGVNVDATQSWSVRGGALYDQNPEPIEAVGPLLPDADRVGYTAGASWHRGPWIVDGAAMFLHFKERNTDGNSPDAFEGTYETDATLFGFNFGYRF